MFADGNGNNPILPINYFIPDVEAHVWGDGRIYLYGSFDIKGKSDYCSKLYHVFSSSDLINWVDHGESFHSDNPNSDVPWSNQNLYAPDVAFKDGKYYLYFCLSDGSEGVASSVFPYGPFKNALKIDVIDGIDPGVFVDDDGQAYIYWGQFDKVRAAKLKANMTEIDESTIVQPLSVVEHNFHEGSSMRKRNGIYYYVYADTSRRDDRPTCLGYATSASPLGPFNYKGVIIDNYGCDPAVWNNHGSIEEFNSKWYVFYHRSTCGGVFSRRVCAEPITFNEDGTIPEVEMTSQGVGKPINAFSRIEASVACLLRGKVRIEDCNEDGEKLCSIENGDYAVYKYIDFKMGARSFMVNVSSGTSGGYIEIRIDNITGPIVGVCEVPSTGGWNNYSSLNCAINTVIGVHVLYLRFIGEAIGKLFNVNFFKFIDSSNV